jgi:cytochrome c oxidase assembly protein Cox11
MKPQDRVITVKFNADLSAQMQWQFKPQQKEIQVMDWNVQAFVSV